MADKVKAARELDPIIHTSVWAEIFSVVAQAVVYAAATAALVAAAPCALVAAVGATAVAVGAGLMLGAATSLIPVGNKSIAEHLSDGCDAVGDFLFPPEEKGVIAEGSFDTNTNSLKSARAAGYQIEDLPDEDPQKPSTLQTLGSLLVGLTPYGWYQQIDTIVNPPVVAQANPGTIPADHDEVLCQRHPPMPKQYIAEGSKEVFINSQPAARDSERTTCDATINKDAPAPNVKISTDVRMGGDSIIVRDIHSGKNKIGQIAGIIIGMVISRRFAGRRCAGNPVSVSTGAKIQNGEEDLDFSLPGMIPITWQRSYSTENISTNGLFGAGWSVFYEVSIERVPHPEGGELSVYINQDSERLELGRLKTGDNFVSILDGLSFFELGAGLTVVEDINTGLYQIFEVDPTNEKRSRLVRLGDRNQNQLNLFYDEQGRLEFLKDPFNNLTIGLNYQGKHQQRVTSIERLYFNKINQEIIENTELLASYNYTEAGDLSEVKDPTGHVIRRFTYNKERYMTSHTLPTGATRYYEWSLFKVPEKRPQPTLANGTPYTLPPLLEPQSTHQWRVVRHWGDEGEEYIFHYDLEKGETRVIDNIGREDIYQWGALYEVTKHIDPLGNCWCYEMVAGQLQKMTDPQGGEWSYSYDEIGRLIETRDPLGRSERITFMEHWALPLVITDVAGNKTLFKYDEKGNLLSEKDPLGHKTAYQYDLQGRVICITDAIDKNKYLFWNDYSQLIKYRDCSSSETHYHYDERGYLTESINARGETIQYHYNSCGYLIQTTLPDGRIEKYLRNKIGLLTSYIDPADKSTDYQYDLSGRVIGRQDAQDRLVRFAYDPYGRLVKLTNENNESYTFEWDALDRLTVQHELDGGARCYHYNPLDDVVGVDYLPSPIDEQKRLKFKAANDEHNLSLETLDIAPISHRLERDIVGRLIKKITDDGVTEYNYNKLDQITAIIFTDTQGNKQSLNYNYDKLGQLIEEVNSAGSLKYAYDELGNIEQITLPDSRKLNHLYYGSGHLHQINLNGLVITDFERDGLHQEVLRTQGRLQTRTRYDTSGRLAQKQIHYHNGPREQQPLLQKEYQYDASDNLIIQRLTQTQRVRPFTTNKQNEQADQLSQKIFKEPSYNHSQTNNDQEIIGRFYAFDAANEGSASRTMQLSNIGKSHSLTQYYNYDSTGRIQQSYQRTEQGQTSHYETLQYDAAANLLSPETTQGYIKYNRVHVYQDKRYSYDRFGRLAEKRIAQHTIQQFKYDAEHRIIEIKQTEHGQSKYIKFKYDPIGRRIEKVTYSESNLQQPIAKTKFQWQGMRLLKEIQNGLSSLYIYEHIGSYEPLARIDGEIGKEKINYFHTDISGLPEQLTDESGNTIWQTQYKIWGNIRDEWHENINNFTQNLRYQGQYYDRETGLHYNTFRYYDPDIGRFTQPDPISLVGGFNLYRYSSNPISWIDPLGWTPLLPTEGNVDTYGNLKGPVGDNITGHHMPSAAYMSQKYGISAKDAVAMNMEHYYPSNTGRHSQTRTFRQKPFLNETPRQALARDIRDARKIYMRDGLYDSKMRESLQKVIALNKEKFPDIFRKPPRPKPKPPTNC